MLNQCKLGLILLIFSMFSDTNRLFLQTRDNLLRQLRKNIKLERPEKLTKEVLLHQTMVLHTSLWFKCCLRYNESQNRPQLLGTALKLAAGSHFKFGPLWVGLKSCGWTRHEFVIFLPLAVKLRPI